MCRARGLWQPRWRPPPLVVPFDHHEGTRSRRSARTAEHDAGESGLAGSVRYRGGRCLPAGPFGVPVSSLLRRGSSKPHRATTRRRDRGSSAEGDVDRCCFTGHLGDRRLDRRGCSLIYSDGMSEVADDSGALFDEDGVLAAVAGAGVSGASASAVVDNVFAHANAFGRQRDDMAAIAVCCRTEAFGLTPGHRAIHKAFG